MGASATNYMFQAGCRGVAKREENLKYIPFIFRMARKRKSLLAAAARAREARHIQATPHSYDPEAESTPPKPSLVVVEITSDEECYWTGGVNHTLSSDSEFYWTDGESADGSTSDSQEFSDVEDEVFLQSLNENLAEELEMLTLPTPYQEVLQKLTRKDWKKAESNRGLGYSGNSDRTKQREAQKARTKAVQDAALRKT